MKKKSKSTGFTLIELLVVISIIGILFGLSIFALQGSRKSARDAKRKSDLELIRSGIEIYRADCNSYPDSLPSVGLELTGDGSSDTCLEDNIYISEIPDDPTTFDRDYLYSSDGLTYEVCAALEGDVETTVTCGGSSNCGETCSYKVTNP